MRIRVAAAADATAIVGLRRRAFAHHAPSGDTEVEVRTLLDDLEPVELAELIEQGQMFVATAAGGTIIGSAGWDDDVIRHVYVEPSRRGQGIGSALLGRAETT